MRLAFRIAAARVVVITGLVPAVTASAAALGSPSSERGTVHDGAAAVPGGTKLWASRYGVAGQFLVANSAVVSPSGSTVFVTGGPTVAYDAANGATRWVTAGGTTGFATVAYDASTGAQLWVARYDGPVAGLDRAVAVAVSPAGSAVFVTGGSLGTSGEQQFATVAYQP